MVIQVIRVQAVVILVNHTRTAISIIHGFEIE